MSTLRLKLTGLFIAVVALTLGCASGSDAGSCRAETAADTVCTANGAVRGETRGGTVAFKNIPYAQAPIGNLRWQPTQAAKPWGQTRAGHTFGSICPQLAGEQVVGDEDCLTLNIWRPAEPASKPLPVMVFFTGGGNHAFSGQGAPVFGGVNYGGEVLVPQSVLFVSFNYRLGALGFLSHPKQALPPATRISGNYGLLDQIAMLKWVRQNIAAFGGDPHRVFLFGTSAGGGNICALLAAPSAQGLFHGAAMQSSVPTGCELATRADAESSAGVRVASALGCDGPDAITCLRGKPAAEVVRALPGSFGLSPRLYGPVVDGLVVTEQPLQTIARGAHARVPVIIGNSTQETMQFVNSVGAVTDSSSYGAALSKLFGQAQSARIFAQYPASAYPSPRDALVQLTTDAFFTCQSRRVARTLAGIQSQPVYRYLFNHAMANDPELKAAGAVHTVEHPFFFPWQGRYRPSPVDLEVQRLMVSHWSHLASVGTTAASPVAWDPVGQGDAYLSIGVSSAMKLNDAAPRCDFWDTVQLPWPHL